ncbi:MAG: M23 family metallopeptidase, partial [Acidobacteriota bacterium]|nr:M23 family metallopeptidase [Acidobacteriota bacterium]
GVWCFDPIEAKPGTVVRWAAEGTESCREGDREWSPHGDTCYFALDLDRTGELEISRVRERVEEHATVRVGDYPYRVQHLKLADSSRVDLSAENLARSQEERARIEALWGLDSSRSFDIPLGAPLALMESRGSFGSRRTFNGQPRSPHSGEDYRATTGTAVMAVARGTVALAEEHFFGGKSVYLDHGDGLVSMYMHLSSIEVEVGASVEPGDRIGRVGATGRVTGPHLHFGLRWRGARVDPAVLLGE